MPEIPKTLKNHLFFNVFGEPILALEAPWGLKKCPNTPPRKPTIKKDDVPPPLPRPSETTNSIGKVALAVARATFAKLAR